MGNPVVVNPDSDLAAIAAENGWEVRHFESAITLRDRLASKETAGAAVATGIAAVLAYWALKGRRNTS